jgi:uncharacterized membrane protein YgdD (TMEM256/DUF423 family)
MTANSGSQRWIIFGSIGALMGVALGAFGAHALESRLSTEALATFETAVRYQMYHSFALLFTGLVSARISRRSSTIAGYLFLCGIILFSGSLYLYLGSGVKAFAMITPLGGLAFLGAWLSLIIAAVQKTRSTDIND